tara:strand:+ start:1898 stop:2065 length:168 start_codon:yes stop_codon:yes gene_type:complete
MKTGMDRLIAAVDKISPPTIDWKLLAENGTLFSVEPVGPGQRLEHQQEVSKRHDV